MIPRLGESLRGITAHSNGTDTALVPVALPVASVTDAPPPGEEGDVTGTGSNG